MGQSWDLLSGMVGLAPKWVRLAPNGTNPGLFQIIFQCIWRPAPNALKSDLKKPRICPIWGQTYHPCFKCYVFTPRPNVHLARNLSGKAKWSLIYDRNGLLYYYIVVHVTDNRLLIHLEAYFFWIVTSHCVWIVRGNQESTEGTKSRNQHIHSNVHTYYDDRHLKDKWSVNMCLFQIKSILIICGY